MRSIISMRMRDLNGDVSPTCWRASRRTWASFWVRLTSRSRSAGRLLRDGRWTLTTCGVDCGVDVDSCEGPCEGCSVGETVRSGAAPTEAVFSPTSVGEGD